MRYWVQFYNKASSGAFTEALGDRQLIYLDGRYSRKTMLLVAAIECRQRGFAGWRLARSQHISRPFYLTAEVLPPAAQSAKESA